MITTYTLTLTSDRKETPHMTLTIEHTDGWYCVTDGDPNHMLEIDSGAEPTLWYLMMIAGQFVYSELE